MENILYNQGFPYVSEIIYFKIINCYYNYLLVRYFKIEKAKKLIAKNTFDLPFIKMLKLILTATIFV